LTLERLQVLVNSISFRLEMAWLTVEMMARSGQFGVKATGGRAKKISLSKDLRYQTLRDAQLAQALRMMAGWSRW